jgi:outer membrane protein assembly factor BamB
LTTRRRVPLFTFIPALILLAVVLTGCSGGSRTLLAGSSWPGINTSDGTIYLAYGPGVYAIDPQTGRALWAFPAEPVRNKNFYAMPAVDGDLVIVADYSGTVYALNRETGSEVWSYPTGSARVIGGATVGNGLVYVGAVNGGVYALDRDSGAEAWQFTADRDIWSSPLLDGDTVYVTSLDRHLYALDAKTGGLRWQFPNGGDHEETIGAMVGTPTLHNGVLYFGSFNNKVYALDTATQTVKWTYEASNWVWGSPLVDEVSGLAIGGDLDGHIFALHLEDGSLAWGYEAEGPVVGTPALAENASGERVVYVTSGDSHIYKLNVEDGTLIDTPASLTATFPTRFLVVPTGEDVRPIPIYAPPVLLGDLLLVGADQGNSPLYAFSSDTLLEQWDFNPSTDA